MDFQQPPTLTKLNQHLTQRSTQLFTSSFELAFEWILTAEGGYSNHAADRGGETLYGLSRRAYSNLDFKTLTLEKVQRIYHRDYWRVCRCDELPNVLAIAVFDAAVNHGPRMAVEMLQRAIKAKPDGILGPNTLAAINLYEHNELLTQYLARRGRRYARIVIKDSSQATFLLGWMHRLTKLQFAIYQMLRSHS